jgi:hypothetical protein
MYLDGASRPKKVPMGHKMEVETTHGSHREPTSWAMGGHGPVLGAPKLFKELS